MDVKFLVAGDSAISVQMGDVISLEVNQKVRMLYNDLHKSPIEGMVEMVPTYAALTIHYRPEQILYDEMVKRITARLSGLQEAEQERQIIKEIPICYDPSLGLDFEECATLENVSGDELIRMHSSHDYYSYMLGFAPGHAYMARFEEPFGFKRRETPRVHIEAGAIVVQENLSNLIPFDQPCGWNIIGATPLKICNYEKEDPFLVHAGEWVRYIPVSLSEYKKIKIADEKDQYQVKTYEKVV